MPVKLIGTLETTFMNVTSSETQGHGGIVSQFTRPKSEKSFSHDAGRCIKGTWIARLSCGPSHCQDGTQVIQIPGGALAESVTRSANDAEDAWRTARGAKKDPRTQRVDG